MKLSLSVFLFFTSFNAFANCSVRLNNSLISFMNRSDIQSVFDETLGQRGYSLSFGESAPSYSLDVTPNSGINTHGNHQLLGVHTLFNGNQGAIHQTHEVSLLGMLSNDKRIATVSLRKALKKTSDVVEECKLSAAELTSIRCEGKPPFRKFQDGRYERKVILRMYDVALNPETLSYNANFILIAQSGRSQFPISERIDSKGRFSIDDHGSQIASVVDGSNPVKFEIDVAKRTCSFEFADGTPRFEGKLTSANHEYLP